MTASSVSSSPSATALLHTEDSSKLVFVSASFSAWRAVRACSRRASNWFAAGNIDRIAAVTGFSTGEERDYIGVVLELCCVCKNGVGRLMPISA